MAYDDIVSAKYVGVLSAWYVKYLEYLDNQSGNRMPAMNGEENRAVTLNVASKWNGGGRPSQTNIGH